jgi:hypothetical protein
VHPFAASAAREFSPALMVFDNSIREYPQT